MLSLNARIATDSTLEKSTKSLNQLIVQHADLGQILSANTEREQMGERGRNDRNERTLLLWLKRTGVEQHFRPTCKTFKNPVHVFRKCKNKYEAVFISERRIQQKI